MDTHDFERLALAFDAIVADATSRRARGEAPRLLYLYAYPRASGNSSADSVHPDEVPTRQSRSRTLPRPRSEPRVPSFERNDLRCVVLLLWL